MTRLLTIRTELLSRITQVTAGLLLAIGLPLGTGPATVSAQPSNASVGSESPSAHWQAAFDEHMTRELRQKPSMRASYLQVLTDVATRKEDLRLGSTTEALLDVIENDTNGRHRMMAVQALHAIGPEHVGERQYEEAMSRLYAFAQEGNSEKLRAAVADMIASYRAG